MRLILWSVMEINSMYQFSGIVQVGDAGTSDVQVVPPWHKKKNVYGGVGQTLEQVAHKSSGVPWRYPSPGQIQSWAAHTAWPCSGLDWMISRRVFPSLLLWDSKELLSVFPCDRNIKDLEGIKVPQLTLFIKRTITLLPFVKISSQ